MDNLPPIEIDSVIFGDAVDRVAWRGDVLAECSGQGGEITRTFCSEPMKVAHGIIKLWLRQAGMTSSVDGLGNLIGERRSQLEDASGIFMTGSHLDSVIDAGRFDGVLGVLLGIACVEVFKNANIELPFDLQVVAFSEEEGVRFGFPFIGSRGIAGTLDSRDLMRKDTEGITVAESLRQFGCSPDSAASSSYAGRPMIGFMEAHIEQADDLQDEQLSLGVVSAIAGQSRGTIHFTGVAGHAGTITHEKRRDALAAAAELVLAVESIGQRTPDLFATIGNMLVKPGLSNVVAGHADLRFDIRHQDNAIRMEAVEELKTAIEGISARRKRDGNHHAIGAYASRADGCQACRATA